MEGFCPVAGSFDTATLNAKNINIHTIVSHVHSIIVIVKTCQSPLYTLLQSSLYSFSSSFISPQDAVFTPLNLSIVSNL